MTTSDSHPFRNTEGTEATEEILWNWLVSGA
jgi:hypothetical protein